MADQQPQQQPPAQQPPAVFALAPALVGAANNEIIDYATRTGQSLYMAATKELSYIFDGKNASIPTFLQAVRDRSTSSGWDDIFQITIGNDANGNPINRDLLTQYGEITIENVNDNARQDYINMPVRNAQISEQIYQCLRKSISSEVNVAMVTKSNNYYVDGQPDGPSFLLTLINNYRVVTKATPTNTRIKLSEAYMILEEEKWKIDNFNDRIEILMHELASSGETTQDLFAHLTRAYKAVPDEEFHRYISNVIDDHNSGRDVIDANRLMQFAKANYDELVEAGKWLKSQAREQQLVALTAQLEQIELKNRQLRNQLKKSGNKTTPPPKNTKTKPGKPGTPNKNKWAWKDVKPKSGQTTKVVDGKTYYWCQYHKKWTLHKSEECRLKPKDDDNKDGGSDDKHTTLQAIYDADQDDGAFADS